ncbi:TAP-like protein [Aquisphaera giovannonii]|uniref:TAP-like protein n=1 Tax=Aquisphaera giovannonii TaxID=406548 RepID=A0A5B9W8Y8_9BACT|nr:dockerin type I repeat-containing protein [Aquisphaera giovannonii]QEH36754.1 TAP-like protein [Aquisphaera giovannonii]
MRRRRRALAVRPSLESMEGRLLLSQTGVNVKQQTDYLNAPVWVDVRDSLRGWTNLNDNGYITSLTPQGYPLVTARTFTSMTGYPAGAYSVSYSGTATLTFSGIASSVTPFTLGADGLYHGTVTINNTKGLLGIQASGLDPSHPFGDLHIITPGYGTAPNQSQIYTDTFLQSIQPFSYLRFLEWDGYGGPSEVNWSDRFEPGDFQTFTMNGVPYEDMITLCNTAHKDMWINIPVRASDDYVKQLADLISSRLDPALKVYVEYTNETWNTSFQAYAQVLAASKSNPLVTATSDIYRVAQQTAYMTKHDGDIFKQEFGASSSRVLPVLPGWAASSDYNNAELSFLTTNYGEASGSAYALAIAPYLDFKLPSTLTADELISMMYTFLETKYISRVSTNSAVATKYGVPLITYEGGFGFFASSTNWDVVNSTITNDPRIAQVYKVMRDLWDEYGGSNFTYYALNDSYWGLVTQLGNPGNYKWDAVMTSILPTGDANGDGVVDSKDLAVVQANMGRTGTWMSQGDSNGDGVVNSKDLALVQGILNGTVGGAFVSRDSATGGGWQTLYGHDGYMMAGVASSLPTYATATVSGATTTVWNSGSTDPRALSTPGSTAGPCTAAAWSSSQPFTIDINLADGQAHSISIYAVDWTRASKVQSVDLVDASSGTVLDSRTLSTISGGSYLTWTIKGHVQIRVTPFAGGPAVISGLFFNNQSGSSQASFVTTDWSSRGNWERVYGSDGYMIAGVASSLPTYATATVSGATTTVWNSGPTEPRNLSTSSSTASPGIAAAWSSSQPFTIDVNLVDGQAHFISLYLSYGAGAAASERIDIINPNSGAVLDSRTITNFELGTHLGLTAIGHVRIRVTPLAGSTAAVSGLFFGQPKCVTSATFISRNMSDQGDWQGVFGADGHDFAGGDYAFPRYATVGLSGASLATWSATTSDGRALSVPGSAAGARLASCWYASGSFTIDVALTDGQPHDVSLYLLDWDNAGRAEQIKVVDPATGAVLDTRSASAFGGGMYLTWRLSGHVQFVVTRTAGPSAAVSGLFFDAPPVSASFAGVNSAAKGDWQGTVGGDGYTIPRGSTSSPSYAAVTVSGGGLMTWSSTTSDGRALSVPGSAAGARLASCWYASGSFTIDVDLGDGQPHDVSLYLLDWDNAGRAEQIKVVDPATGAVLDTRSASAFGGGMYLTWRLSGHVQFVVTRTAGPSAAVSGLFFDAPPVSASFAGVNSAAKGDWQGTVGGDGYTIPRGSTSSPSYAAVTVSGGGLMTWSATTSDGRALSVPGSAAGARLASCWYASGSFTIDVALTDGQPHDVSLYLLDWDNAGRAEQIKVVDPATGAVLDTRSASAFGGGMYLTWRLSGHVQFVVTRTAGPSAAVSGLFFDAPPVSASFAGVNSAAKGDWQGTVGGDGYTIPRGSTSGPQYATVALSGASLATWSSTTSDGRALSVSGSIWGDRAASCWYASGSFTIDVALTDGRAHDVSLYLLDWDNAGRAEQIDIVDATTGAVLDTRSASAFGGGVYLTWRLSGHVQFVVTRTAGPSAAVSGLFFGGAPASPSPFLGTNAAAKGDWQGNLGLDGHSIPRGDTSIPSYAVVTPSGAGTFSWSSTTSDGRALSVPGSISGDRLASCWYASGSFTIDVALTDGQPHDVSLYLLDWDNAGRAEQIKVVDPATGAVLDTRSASAFGGGAYLTWKLSGHVQFVVTRTAGPNAAVSGLFFDAPTNWASFAGFNSATKGDWQGTVGGDGYTIPRGSTSGPQYATVALSGTYLATWSSTTSDGRALSVPGSAAGARLASCWYASDSFTIDVALTDGRAHDVSLYLLDWDNAGRAEQIKVVDPATGAVLDTRSATAFGGGAYLTWKLSGHVQFVVTRTAGPNAAVSGLFFNAPTNWASFAGVNSAAKGDWQGTVGSDGYTIPRGSTSGPQYATVGLSGASLATWSWSTADARALSIPGSIWGDRAASCWYASGSFTIDVALTDGRAHDVSLYLLDWDNAGRAEQIRVVDAATGAVLDTRSATAFGGGVYLTWKLSGHVQFVVTRIAGPNAAVSGLFFGGAPTVPSPFVRVNAAAKGDWQGKLGWDGYNMPRGSTSGPQYATVALSGASLATWSSTTSDGRALSVPGSAAGARLASCWYASGSFTIDVDLGDGQPHDVSLYLLDWDNAGRAEQIKVVDAATGAVLDTRSATAFGGGAYLTWKLSGHVQFVVTRTAGPNAAVSGLFFDAPTNWASFAGVNSAAKGDWQGTVGGDGYTIPRGSTSGPQYATVGLSGASLATWSWSTADARALSIPGSIWGDRAASCWYASGSFTIDVALTDGRAHDVSLYLLDWDNAGRAEQIKVVDTATGAVLDTRSASAFGGGMYLTWRLSGHVQFVVTRTAGPNAAVSGLFFGGAPMVPSPFAGVNSAAKGDWQGTVGGDGYTIPRGSTSGPQYATVALSGASLATWSSTSDGRALSVPGSAAGARLASRWYASGSFTIDVALTDGQPHDVSLYLLDWDNAGRAEQIKVVDPATGAVLDTRSATAFGGGVYLTWRLSGHAQFVVTRTAGPNAVVSGLFFD